MTRQRPFAPPWLETVPADLKVWGRSNIFLLLALIGRPTLLQCPSFEDDSLLHCGPMSDTTSEEIITSGKPRNGSITFKLSVMMFLEFFIWGAWLPLIFGYLPSLGFTGLQMAWILNAFAIASFVGMFFSNQFADRNFSAERFLAFSHFVGGISILGLAWTKEITAALGLPSQFWPFFILMLVHSLFYVPTISITNSISFANLRDAATDFPRIRLWGTIGWIAASWPFVFLLVDWQKVPAMSEVGFGKWMGLVLGTPLTGPAALEAIKWTFITAGIASLALAAFSLTLPHTPPKKAKTSEDKFALVESLRLLAMPFMFILFVVTFIDAAVHQCYFIWTDTYLTSVGIPKNWVMPIMSIGQIAEIGTMAFLGYCLKGLGWRYTMAIGVLGHAIRFAVFALVPFPIPAAAIIVIHGICYAFFFATVYIFVDEFFPKDARTSAQGLFNFLILGLGPFIANFVWPLVGDLTATVDVSANVIRESRGTNLVIAGKVLNLAKEGEIELVHTPANASAATPVAGRRTLTTDEQGEFENVLRNAPLGSYTLTIPTERKYFLFPPRPEKFTFTVERTEKQDKLEPGNRELIGNRKQINFQSLFLAPALTALLASLALVFFFHPPAKAVPAKVGH